MARFIQVAADGRGFTEGPGGPRFVPFGCNYFDPKTGWAPKIWKLYDHERVARHFGQIAGAGLNAIRVFLDMGILNPAPGEYSAEGFGKVDDMVKTAAAAGLRIIFSGPNTWHGTPDHRRGDPYTDPRQIELTHLLWQKIAGRWRDEPAVMTWDLFNEPMVGWPTRAKGWLGDTRLAAWRDFAQKKLGAKVGDDLVSADTAGQDHKLWTTYLDFQETLAEQWTARQAKTLRDAGAKQMISVGLIQWGIPVHLARAMGPGGFNPRRIAPHLDYLSAHFYPILRKGNLENELDLQRAYLEVVLRATYVQGKPLVLEEFGWKGGKAPPGDAKAMPEEHQTLWGEALMACSGRVAAGWLNWGYADAADPKADISAASGLWTEEERIKHWGKRFGEYAAKYKAAPPAYQPAARRIEVNTVNFLFQHGGHPQLDWLEGQIAGDPKQSIEVVFM